MGVRRISEDIDKKIEAYMGIHNIDNISDALRRILEDVERLSEENKKLREENACMPASQETESSAWQDIQIRCDFLIKILQNQYDCLNKKPPIRVTHPLFSSEICRICQRVNEQMKQISKMAESKVLKGISEHSLITDETRRKYPRYVEPKKRHEPDSVEWHSNEQ
jgi:hypothetical protein